jgi:hypothetical protein
MPIPIVGIKPAKSVAHVPFSATVYVSVFIYPLTSPAYLDSRSRDAEVGSLMTSWYVGQYEGRSYNYK